MNEMVEEVSAYKCNWCGEIYNREIGAAECAFKHAKTNLANALLKQGSNLEQINYMCGFHWNLSDEKKKITKDNCFIISHWQCCEKPAYQIQRIEANGLLWLWGKGSWSSGYGDYVSIDRLPEPYPKEELYSYK